MPARIRDLLPTSGSLQVHLADVLADGSGRMDEACEVLADKLGSVQGLLRANLADPESAPHHWSYLVEKLKLVRMYCDDLACACEALAEDVADVQRDEEKQKRRRKQANPRRGRRTAVENELFEPDAISPANSTS